MICEAAVIQSPQPTVRQTHYPHIINTLDNTTAVATAVTDASDVIAAAAVAASAATTERQRGGE